MGAVGEGVEADLGRVGSTGGLPVRHRQAALVSVSGQTRCCVRVSLPLYFIVSLMLAACSSAETTTETETETDDIQSDEPDTTGDTADEDTGGEDTGGEDTGGEDTGGEDTGGDDTGDTESPAEAMIANHVITSLEVGGWSDGFDLDGDGTTDNALSLTGAVLDPVLDRVFQEAPVVLVLQCADLDDWHNDEAFDLGLLTANDTDGDSTDNFSGTEIFDAGGMVNADGEALLASETALESGEYKATLLADTLTIGSFELSLATPIYLSGAPSASAHDVVLGMGINTSALIALLEVSGYADAATLLNSLSDLDTDSDGTNDAISAAFLASAVSCQLE